MDNRFRLILSLIIAVSLGGCATMETSFRSRKPNYPVALTGEMRSAFSLANESYMKGDIKGAENLYQSYITSYGYNELTDEARFKLGEIAFLNRNYDKAISHYREAYQNLYNPDIAPKAQFKEALALFNKGRFSEAYSVIERMERRDMSKVLALRVDSLAARISARLGHSRNVSIKWHLFLLDDYDAAAERDYTGKIPEQLVLRDKSNEEVLKWVRDANVTVDEINALPIELMKGKTSGGFVQYKLAMAYFAAGDIDNASKYMGKFVRGYPKHEFAADGRRLLAGLKGRTGGKSYKIGVILPLSGRYQIYGKSTLNGIQCAAGLTPPCSSPVNVELIIKDDGGQPALAAEAVVELAKENVIAIVGPLVSDCAESAAVKAEELKIPMVTLTHKEGITRTGQYIFKHSLTAGDQIDTLIDYAMGTRKLKNFAVIYPSNSYGVQFARMFKEAVQTAGGKVVYEKSYSHQELGASPPVEEEGGVTTMGEEIVTGKTKVFDVPSSVEAIFIPDSYKAIGYVVRMIHADSQEMASNVLFMGVNRWNNPGLVGRDIGLLEGAVFVDGFFKRSADVTTRIFIQSFTSAFGLDPTILEAQAYDAMGIVMAGVKNGGTSRSKLAAAIKGLKNVGGATGSITIGEDGESKRRLFILTIKNGQIDELSSTAERGNASFM